MAIFINKFIFKKGKSDRVILSMRIDKFLKVSRLIKRRTVANEVADAGRIIVNGKEVKASYQVKIGDEVQIMFGTKPVKVKVLSVENTVSKDDAREMYTVIEE